jgi:hypothetical protein
MLKDEHTLRDFVVRKGILYRKPYKESLSEQYNRIVVPQTLKEYVLRLHHGSPLPGHPGGNKLYRILKTRYYWSKQRRDTRLWVKACSKCV